jgi:hypothetical protein
MEKIAQKINGFGILRLLLYVSVLFLYCSDTYFTRPVLLCSDDDASPCQGMDTRFEDYDAYFICDELFIEASYSKLYSTACNKVIYNKKLKILTEKGKEYGMFTIPLLTYIPKQFNVELKDSTGKNIPLDVEQLKLEYLRKGSVVVPKVTVGCEISVYVEFSAWFILPYYEFRFTRKIPSALTSFTFSEYTPLQYDFKTYNLAIEPEVRTVTAEGGQDIYRYHTYRIKNVLPQSDLAYQPSTDKIEPRVSVVLRNAFDRSIITNWYELSTNFERTYFQECRENRQSILAGLSQAIKDGSDSDFDAADSALRFVQNFTIREDGKEQRCIPDDILYSRKGSVWEITALLRMMYHQMGFQTDVVVTRAQDYGGFDTEYVNPLSLKIPLLIVTINDTDYIAFPFRRGGKLGEYPVHLQSLEGLSLTQKKTVTLPPSTAGYSRSALRFRLNPDKDTSEQHAVFSLYGSIAYETRVALQSVQEEKRDEFFQRWLTSLGTSNALRTCSIEGMEMPGEPLRVHCTFSNMNQMISRGRFSQISFSNLFERYLGQYDTSRVEEVVIQHRFIDTVEIEMPVGGMRVKPFINCEPADNELFSVDCEQNRRGDTLRFRRIVNVKQTILDSSQMRNIYPELRNLNDIRESGVIIRRKRQKRKL